MLLDQPAQPPPPHWHSHIPISQKLSSYGPKETAVPAIGTWNLDWQKVTSGSFTVNRCSTAQRYISSQTDQNSNSNGGWISRPGWWLASRSGYTENNSLEKPLSALQTSFPDAATENKTFLLPIRRGLLEPMAAAVWLAAVQVGISSTTHSHRWRVSYERIINLITLLWAGWSCTLPPTPGQMAGHKNCFSFVKPESANPPTKHTTKSPADLEPAAGPCDLQ